MAAEFEYLKELSKGGEISLCTSMNDGMTSFLDAMFGADEVDAFDASCNTCGSFVRFPMTREQKAERNVFGMPGRCASKDIEVTGWQRGQFCGFENGACYRNRRTGKKPADACLGK